MKGLRLLLVHSHGTDVSYGGAERYVAHLAEGMHARGFEVRVLSAFPGPSSIPRAQVHVLHSSDWRSNRVRRLSNHAGTLVARPTARLADVLEQVRPDVVHTNNLVGITTAVWEAARRAGAPVVHTLHDYFLLCPRVTLLRPDGDPCRPHPLLCGFRARRLARFAPVVAHVLGVSRFILERHAHLFPTAQRDVLHHPLEEQDLGEPPPPGRHLKTLGYLGALERTKGVDRLLEAVPALIRAGVTVRIAGRGRLQPDVEAAAADIPELHYEGHLTDVPKHRFFTACDAGILPAVWDEPGGPPYVLVEWLNVGRPVLSSSRGGLREAIEDLHGVVPIEPTAAGIEAAVQRLTSPDAWVEAAQAVRPPPTAGRTLADWLEAHERVYRRLARQAA